jgi:HK97 gp10 family phage protein
VRAKIQMRGTDELLRKLERMRGVVRAEKSISESLMAAAKPMRERIVALAPRGKGSVARRKDKRRLYQRIRSVLDRSSKGRAVRIVADSPVAHLLEFGTVKMRSRMFMRPAFGQVQNVSIERFRQQLGVKIEAAAK